MTTTTRTKTPKAFVVNTDCGDGGTVVVFAVTAVEARRVGAQQLDTDFEDVESCRRAPEFDRYVDMNRVPNEVLFEHGWWFECWGCEQRISDSLVGEWRYEGISREINLKPVFKGDTVYCCPACKARDEKYKRIRREAEASAIAYFKQRLLKRFPDAKILNNDEHGPLRQLAHVDHQGIRQVVITFEIPGITTAPAQLRYELLTAYREKSHGPSAPRIYCIDADAEVFQEYAKRHSEPSK